MLAERVAATDVELERRARLVPERVRRVGLLISFPENDPLAQVRVTAFAQALGRFGWVEGKNIRIDYRFAAGDPTLFKTYAAELVGLCRTQFAGTPPAVAALRQQTRHTDRFRIVSDPVGQGVVGALHGGNVTGFSAYDAPIMGKWLQLLKEVAQRSPGRRHLQPGHRAFAPLFSRDRDGRPVLGDDGDACSGRRRGIEKPSPPKDASREAA